MIRQVDKVSATGRFICLRFCIGIPSSLFHPHTHAYIIREFVSCVRPFQVINLCIFTQCIHDFLHKSINVRTKWYLSSQMSYFNHLTVHRYECMRMSSDELLSYVTSINVNFLISRFVLLRFGQFKSYGHNSFVLLVFHFLSLIHNAFGL